MTRTNFVATIAAATVVSTFIVPVVLADELIRNDFSGVSESSLLGSNVVPAAAQWTNVSGHEAGAGAAFAQARGLAAVYDDDNDPATPDINIPGGYEINGYADVYPAHTLTITTKLPAALSADGIASLSFWAAFRLSGTVADTSGAGVRIRNATKGVDLVPLSAPTFAADLSRWQFNQFTFKQDPSHAGDTIEVMFHAGGVDDSSGLALTNITVQTDVKGSAAIATPRSDAIVVLKQAVRPPVADPNVQVQPDQPLEKDRPRHGQLMREKQELLKNGPIQVVFIGDSITYGWRMKPQIDLFNERWGAYNPYNIGISGDETQHVLWRIEHGALDGLQPKAVVLMIGTNNIGNANHMTAEATVTGVRAVIRSVKAKLPSAKILLLGILPRGASPDDAHRATIKSVNTALAPMDDGGKTLRFVDVGSEYVDGQGGLIKSLMPDELHPNAEGYRVWADAIDVTLISLLR